MIAAGIVILAKILRRWRKHSYTVSSTAAPNCDDYSYSEVEQGSPKIPESARIRQDFTAFLMGTGLSPEVSGTAIDLRHSYISSSTRDDDMSLARSFLSRKSGDGVSVSGAGIAV